MEEDGNDGREPFREPQKGQRGNARQPRVLHEVGAFELKLEPLSAGTKKGRPEGRPFCEFVSRRIGILAAA